MIDGVYYVQHAVVSKMSVMDTVEKMMPLLCSHEQKTYVRVDAGTNFECPGQHQPL